MICGHPNRTYFYCVDCANNPDNRPWSDVWSDVMEYPQIEPVSGDCLSYRDDNDDADI